MQFNKAYRLTINGEGENRQYHLYSRWLVQIYIQTYQNLGKQISIEQLIDGLWTPAIV